MAVLASRLFAPPSLARSQREFASNARLLALSLSLSLHGTGLMTVVLVPVVPPSRAPFEAV
jgi:hypothetical protein